MQNKNNTEIIHKVNNQLLFEVESKLDLLIFSLYILLLYKSKFCLNSIISYQKFSQLYSFTRLNSN